MNRQMSDVLAVLAVAAGVLVWIAAAFGMGTLVAWAIPGPGGYAAWRVGVLCAAPITILGLLAIAVTAGDSL